jgi:hypothetical protein
LPGKNDASFELGKGKLDLAPEHEDRRQWKYNFQYHDVNNLSEVSIQEFAWKE